jgi:hypothetical protein
MRMRIIRLGLACLGLVLLAAAVGAFGTGAVQEALWTLCIIAGSVLFIGATAAGLRKRIQEKTLGRLVRAFLGAALAAAAFMSAFIAIDRLVIDLHGQILVPALFMTICVAYTFHRLDRAPNPLPKSPQ